MSRAGGRGLAARAPMVPAMLPEPMMLMMVMMVFLSLVVG
jgi:hypothetical protein